MSGTDIRSLQLVINSKDREDYDTTTSSEFTVTLQNPINFDILAYGLESCCLPKTSYNISNGEFQATMSTGEQTYNITPGNYSIVELLSAISSALSVDDATTVSYSASTMKITFTSAFSGFVLNPNQVDSPLVEQLGFLNNLVYHSTAGVLVAPKVYDISGIKNVYIKIAQLTEYMRDTKNLSSNFKVDYGCPYGSIIYFANKSKYEQFYTTAQNHIRRSSKFDVRLVDEKGNNVDLNGSDWSFVLRFLTKDLY